MELEQETGLLGRDVILQLEPILTSSSLKRKTGDGVKTRGKTPHNYLI